MQTTRVGDVNLAWYERGTGSPVLCIMGLGGRASDWNERFMAGLAPHHRLVTFDNRGTGRSDRPEETYTLEQMADEAVGVLHAAGLDRAHVMGTSMGGMIAQLLALRHPEVVDRLVLLCTHMGGPSVTPPTPAAMAIFTADRALPADELVRRSMTAITAPGFAARHPEAIKGLVALARAQPTPPATFMRQMQAIMTSDRSDRLGAIAAPTLVVHGTEDPLVPTANGAALARAIPGARHVEIPGCGHMMSWEVPDALAEIVGEFLAARG
jgi:pimeloyl-ACP methyl ester carboxylesterase